MLRHLAAALITLAAALCGLMWALSSPVGSSPDDNFHQATIWCVDATSSTDGCKVVGESDTGGREVELPALVANPNCYAFAPAESAACQKPLQGERVVTAAVDNGEYPGGFHRVMHWFVGDSIPESILLMRFINVALAALLLGGLAIATTREIRRLMAYTLVPVLVPLGWFIIASVNPSSWALTGLTTFGFALHTFLSVSGTRRRAVVALLGVVGLVMALAARGDAPVYAVVVTGAFCVLHWRRLWDDRRLLVIPLVVGLVGIWRVLGAAQVSSIAGAAAETDRTPEAVIANLVLEFPALISGMFGYGFGLGWLDTPVHPITAYPVALVIGYLGLSGLGRLTKAKAIAALMIFVPMLAIPLMTLYRTRLIVGESVQPRYLLPLMPMLLAVLLVGRVADTTFRMTRAQASLVAIALLAANTAAVYANLRRYVTGTDGPAVIDNLEWWWQSAPSPTMVTILCGVGFAVFASSLVLVSGAADPVDAGNTGTTGDTADTVDEGDRKTLTEETA